MIAKALMKSKRRSSLPIARQKSLLSGLLFEFFHPDVHATHHGVNEIYEQLNHLMEEDLVVIINFPRYTNRTLELAKLVHNKGLRFLPLRMRRMLQSCTPLMSSMQAIL